MADPEAARRKVKLVPSYAAIEMDLNNIRELKSDWIPEDGFPCSHKRPQEYFSESGVTWLSLYNDYKSTMEAKGDRVLSYGRFA